MKPKFKRLSKKLMSIYTALSLTFAMFILPGNLSENVKAGTLVNIVTGKWAAIGLEYFERGAMRALGAAASHAENETVSTILTKTKRLLGNPQSNALADIKQLCMQMNAKLDYLIKTANENNTYVSERLDQIDQKISRSDYNECINDVRDVDSDSDFIIGKFTTLLTTVDKLDADDQQSIKALQLAYEDLYSIYESNTNPGSNPNYLGKQFNFTKDAEKLASLLSTYNYSYTRSGTIDYSIDPADKGEYDRGSKSYKNWVSIVGGKKVIEKYYDNIKR